MQSVAEKFRFNTAQSTPSALIFILEAVKLGYPGFEFRISASVIDDGTVPFIG
jgi:hypothetical protein